MRLGIYLADQDRARTSSQGIITYSVAMTNHVCAELAPSESCVIFASASIAPELDVPDDVDVRVSAPPTNAWERVRSDQLESDRLARAERVDAMYFPKGFMPIGMHGSVASVATIHDDIPLRYVRGVWGFRSIRPGHVYAALSILLTLRRAAVVTCPSELVATRLRGLGRGSRPLVVTPPGVPDAISCVDASQRVLVVTSSATHKRTPETLEWVERVATAHPEREFVLVGARSPTFSTLAPPPTAEAMNREIAASAAVVFNSEYEGFGLPPVEAWALGTPATYPAIEPLSTNLAGVPGAFQPRSYASFASAFDGLLHLDSSAVAKHQHTVRERFSWSTSARDLLDATRRATAR